MGNKKFFHMFGSHYAIERFGLVFLSLIFCMALLMSSIVTKKIRYDHRSLSGRAVYTTSFTTSLTNSSGLVRNVYCNEDHTEIFLLWYIQDMSALPVDPNDYSFYLRAVDLNGYRLDMESDPTCKFYMFGNTGYMGVYLRNVEPFPSQLMRLTLRSNKNFTGQVTSKTYADKSYEHYDQGDIVFNPGGNFAVRASFFDTVGWTPFDIYEEIVTRSRERTARTTLFNDLIAMKQYQLIASEYISRLKDSGITEVSVPSEIDGDYIYAEDPKVTGSRPKLDWVVSASGWVDVENQGKAYMSNQVWQFLRTTFTVPRGINFDWQDGTVRLGYLYTLTQSRDLQVWADFLNSLGNSNALSSFDVATELYRSDGSPVDLTALSASTVSSDSALADYVSRLREAWFEYYKLKVKYQSVDLVELLNIEYDARTVEHNYSVSDGDPVKHD